MRVLSIFFNVYELGKFYPGEWVGADQNGPSILLQFKYSYKKDVPIQNLATKIV